MRASANDHAVLGRPFDRLAVRERLKMASPQKIQPVGKGETFPFFFARHRMNGLTSLAFSRLSRLILYPGGYSSTTSFIPAKI